MPALGRRSREEEELPIPRPIARVNRTFTNRVATPLAARITGTIVKDGYKVEKILFESQPGHYVTAALFLPTDARYRGKRLPAVLVVSGHSRDAKGYAAYQKGAALAAIHGFAAFAVDPIEQGERVQIGKRWGTSAHIAMGVGSILVGRSTATY